MRRPIVVAVLVASVAVGAATRVWGLSSRAGGGRTAQGYLGVDVRDALDDDGSGGKSRNVRGAEIVRLDHDGPACKAGVRERDVVLQMDGRGVEGQEQFRHMLHETAAGRVVTLVVLREGQQQTIRATMANREEVEREAWKQHLTVVDPEESNGRHASSFGFLHGSTAPGESKSRGFLGSMLGGSYTGAIVEPITPQLGDFFGVQSGAGLLVTSVDPNSPAATAGMRAGDVVIKLNQVTMTTEGEWTKSLHEAKGQAMPVLVLRDKKEQTLTLTPEAKRRSRMEPAVPTDEMMLARADLLGGRD